MNWRSDSAWARPSQHRAAGFSREHGAGLLRWGRRHRARVVVLKHFRTCSGGYTEARTCADRRIVLEFAFLVSLLTGVGFGVFPAWSASRSDSSGLWRRGANQRRAQRTSIARDAGDYGDGDQPGAAGGLGIAHRSCRETMRVQPASIRITS